MDGDTARAGSEVVESERQSQRSGGRRGQGEAAPPRRSLKPFIIFGVVLVAAAIAGTLYWLHARNFESTDDAFIDGDISQVAPRVSGQLMRVLVTDNQEVRAGDLMVEIDPRDLRVKLDQAIAQRGSSAAQLAEMQAKAAMQLANLDQASADARVSEADLTQAQLDANRFRAINPAAITRQQLDNANAGLRSAQAKLDSKRQAVASASAQLKSAEAQVLGAEASLKDADVTVANAQLQLSYTRVTAPVDGRVTKRSAVAGNYVSPGTPLLSLVPKQVWVTANFKETQLARMRPGQPVDVAVDAFPDIAFHGHVESFQSGTGSAFATLPAENATGNYVKVVQRLPVKITLDQAGVDEAAAHGAGLAPGMSVVPSVTVR